jgi:hypothetical protein
MAMFGKTKTACSTSYDKEGAVRGIQNDEMGASPCHSPALKKYHFTSDSESEEAPIRVVTENFCDLTELSGIWIRRVGPTGLQEASVSATSDQKQNVISGRREFTGL